MTITIPPSRIFKIELTFVPTTLERTNPAKVTNVIQALSIAIFILAIAVIVIVNRN